MQSVSIDLTILLEAREVYGSAMSKSATLCDTIYSALNRLLSLSRFQKNLPLEKYFSFGNELCEWKNPLFVDVLASDARIIVDFP